MSEEEKTARRFKFAASDDGAAWSGVDGALVLAACVLYVGARVWRLGATCLWFDEIFGVHAAAWHGWAGMWRFAALDLIHPPLFYAVLKVWAGAFGAGSVWWLRALPVALSLASVVPVVLLARELGLGGRVVGVALLLAASSGLLVKYAQELRMYSLLLLCAACSLWLFARLCNARDGGDAHTPKRGDGDSRSDDASEHGAGSEHREGSARGDGKAGRDGEAGDGEAGDGEAEGDEARARRRGRVTRAAVALSAANLALVYTHYFGWLLVVLEAIFVAWLLRERWKVFCASVAALVVCFAPWAWAVWQASRGAGAGLEQNLGWAERPRALELLAPYLALHEPWRAQRQSNEPFVLPLDALLALLLFAPPLVALCRRMLAPRRKARQRDREPAAVAVSRNETVDAAARALCERRALAFLIFFAFAPVAAAFALAQVLPQSIWGVRHLIVVTPAYLLLVAVALTRVRARWLSILSAVVLGCWLALAAAVALTSRAPVPVWCAWDALALQAARDDATTAARDDATAARDEATAARDDATTGARDGASARDVQAARGAQTIYAFEDLVAYQLWHALRAAGEGRLRVVVVRGAPGVADDRAFFLPRGFDDVAVETTDGMTREEEFWIALRGARWEEDAPVVKLLRERGYDVEPRHEFDADGQKAFVALVRRR